MSLDQTPVQNALCPICSGLYNVRHERDITKTHHWHTQPHRADRLYIPTCPEEGLSPFWRVELFCHGRYEQTDVVVESLLLDSGASQAHGYPAIGVRFIFGPPEHQGMLKNAMAYIAGSVPEHDFHGSFDQTKIVPYLAEGMFPVFCSPDPHSLFSVHQAPLVHMVMWWEDHRG